MNERSWSDRRFDKWHQVIVATPINSLNPYPSKAFGLQHLHCDGDQNLGGIALTSCCTDRVYSVSERKVGFIDLDFPME